MAEAKALTAKDTYRKVQDWFRPTFSEGVVTSCRIETKDWRQIEAHIDALTSKLAQAERERDSAKRAYVGLTSAEIPASHFPDPMPDGAPPGTDPQECCTVLRSLYFVALDDSKWYHNAYWAQKRRAEQAEQAVGVLAREVAKSKRLIDELSKNGGKADPDTIYDWKVFRANTDANPHAKAAVEAAEVAATPLKG